MLINWFVIPNLFVYQKSLKQTNRFLSIKSPFKLVLFIHIGFVVKKLREMFVLKHLGIKAFSINIIYYFQYLSFLNSVLSTIIRYHSSLFCIKALQQWLVNSVIYILIGWKMNSRWSSMYCRRNLILDKSKSILEFAKSPKFNKFWPKQNKV